MDLTDLRLEVRERLGELTADFFTDDEVDRAINEAQRHFCNEEKWPFLLTEWTTTLSSATEELDLPSDISLTRVKNIAVSGGALVRGRMVERVNDNEGFRLRYLYTNLVGPPQWYYITRSNQDTDNAPPVYYTAKFIPIPDADYTIEAQYFAVPVTLTGAAEEPMVPTEYQEAIVARATGKLFLKEIGSISQKASEQFALYAQVLEQAREDLMEQSSDEIVALGRRQPLVGQWGSGPWDPRFRVPPTIG